MKKNVLYTVALGSCLIFAACKETPTVSDPTGAPAGKVSAAIKDVEAAEAGKLVAGENPPVVIDVRTPEEFAEGHIEGAVNIDFKADTFKEELSKLDPKKEYLMHCRSGKRSTSAKPVFEELGFENVYHLDGGFNAWTDAELPTAK